MKTTTILILALSIVLLVAACSGSPAETGTQPSASVETIYDFNISLYQGSDALGSETVAVSELRGERWC